MRITRARVSAELIEEHGAEANTSARLTSSDASPHEQVIGTSEPLTALTPAAEATALAAAPVAIEPLPARMLNEFVYCPRLFYYEFVEGVFVHNADTLRGGAIHARVDSGSGAMPAPDAISAPETIHSRSVSLGSERLGVTAKIDLVEITSSDSRAPNDDLFAQRRVCPVDYKAGAPRPGEDENELWPADKMQLGLQCLLLRDNGYTCDEGVIYYRATKQRVRLEITPEVETWVLQQIRHARACAAGPIPPPLIDSPKCPRCSLVTVCLPDETRLLTGATLQLATSHHSPSSPPRRLIAACDDTRALYLTTPGLFVGRKDEVIQIKDKKEVLQEVRILDLSHVALFGNIQISTAAVQALCQSDVPVTYFSLGGWFYGFTRGHSLKNVFTRVEQFRRARDPAVCLGLARRIVRGKILNQRTMLMRNHLEPPAPILAKLKNSAETALHAHSIDELLGVEGAAASFYFNQFSGMLKVADELSQEGVSQLSTTASPARTSQLNFNFDFTTRKRRPPTDPVNALLSLAYSLLAKDCTIAAHAVGLDPYIGFYHQPRFGRPALALDLMEEFRPLIAESVALTAINNHMITERDFVRAGRAVNLSAAGRKQFFVAYEQRMNHLITHPIFEYKVTYRRAIELQFRILARYLTSEIEQYIPFTTR
ncbi:MAG: CRISPR-associated endonuclease Cas4g/Cas1g [Chthoniobacterales bacterium]